MKKPKSTMQFFYSTKFKSRIIQSGLVFLLSIAASANKISEANAQSPDKTVFTNLQLEVRLAKERVKTSKLNLELAKTNWKIEKDKLLPKGEELRKLEANSIEEMGSKEIKQFAYSSLLSAINEKPRIAEYKLAAFENKLRVVTLNLRIAQIEKELLSINSSNQQAHWEITRGLRGVARAKRLMSKIFRKTENLYSESEVQKNKISHLEFMASSVIETADAMQPEKRAQRIALLTAYGKEIDDKREKIDNSIIDLKDTADEAEESMTELVDVRDQLIEQIKYRNGK